LQALCLKIVPSHGRSLSRVLQDPPDELPGQRATTGTPQDARISGRSECVAGRLRGPALDEGQASPGAQSARTALLHPWRAAVTLPLSRSMRWGIPVFVLTPATALLLWS
jgi:hypothetical protein